MKNELLIQLGLENMNFPATAVPVELQRVRQECSQLAWCFLLQQGLQPHAEAAYDADYPGWGLTQV